MLPTIPSSTDTKRRRRRTCRAPRSRTITSPARPYAARYSPPACRGEDVALFDGDEALALFAKALCHQCPLQSACLEYGLRHAVDGIWGGTTRAERVELRRELGLTPRSLSWDDDDLFEALYRSTS